MAKVKLRLPSWIARMLDAKATGWLTLEKEMKDSATVDNLLMNLVATYPGFREAVFNPDTGGLNDQISVILNNKLLTFKEVSETRLKDGDTIVLLPLYYGG
ncbi:MAG: MoaD/ThiS family protein [Chloroflexota bacterium]